MEEYSVVHFGGSLVISAINDILMQDRIYNLILGKFHKPTDRPRIY